MMLIHIRKLLPAGFTVLFMTMSAFTVAASNLKPMTDTEMAAEQGQTLFNLSYIAPGGANPNANIGFYRLGIEANLELNANIKKLQLGCGGINGTGCDVDIDNMSFTGFAKTGVQGAGVATDFFANNPFVEFAINNPNSASTRQTIGLRVGFLQSAGMLSFGSINQLTGDLGITVTNGNVPLATCIGGISADRSSCIGLAVPLGTATIMANQPNAGSNRFNIAVARASSFTLNDLKAIWMGLTVPANLNESFSYIHSLALGSQNADGSLNYTKDFAFSLSALGNNAVSNNAYTNSNNLKWQRVSDGSWYAAPRGWSMSIPSLTVSPNGFTSNTVNVSPIEALGGVLGVPIQLNNLDLNLKPVSNCYKLTFC